MKTQDTLPEAGQYAPSPLEGEGLGEGFKKRAAFTFAEEPEAGQQLCRCEEVPEAHLYPCHAELVSASFNKDCRRSNPANKGLLKGWIATLTTFTRNDRKQAAFTLAEVLITLGIIGVVAALTVPTLMSNYKKRITEVRLQQTWSILNNAVNMAKVTHGDVEGWDFSLRAGAFIETYLEPVLRNTQAVCPQVASSSYTSSCTMSLSNGVKLSFTLYNRPDVPTVGQYMHIVADINGSDKPNILGLDKFYFHLVPKAKIVYNTGDGDALYNVPRAGLYYDGYGFSDLYLKTNKWRGCSSDIIENNSVSFGCGTTRDCTTYQGAYCVALIAKNNWKIPDNYPKKF